MRQMRSIRESDFRSGICNMAVDSAIVEAVGAGRQMPTLRLYGWKPFCLSLGYGQRIRDADVDALQERGWNLVRRPTGGKAILHGDELTYSLCLSLDHPLAGGDLIESYRRISVGLLQALDCLGLSATARHQAASARQSAAGAVCFELSSHYEITFAGRKLVGSAQLRRKGVMLQHGTIPLRGDVARICDVLRFDSEAALEAQKQRVRERTLSLAQVLARAPSWAEVASAFERGFTDAFELELIPGQLSECESARAEELALEQFANPEWTSKR